MNCLKDLNNFESSQQYDLAKKKLMEKGQKETKTGTKRDKRRQKPGQKG